MALARAGAEETVKVGAEVEFGSTWALHFAKEHPDGAVYDGVSSKYVTFLPCPACNATAHLHVEEFGCRCVDVVRMHTAPGPGPPGFRPFFAGQPQTRLVKYALPRAEVAVPENPLPDAGHFKRVDYGRVVESQHPYFGPDTEAYRGVENYWEFERRFGEGMAASGVVGSASAHFGEFVLQCPDDRGQIVFEFDAHYS